MSERSRPDRDRTRQLFADLNSLDEASPEYRAVRDELVAAHMPLVRYLARRFAGRGEPSDDLLQIGTIGLLQAIDRFEPGRGLEFSTFATPNIAGEIKRHFRDRGWMVKVPRRLQELQAELTTGIGELSQRLGRSPTVAELAAHLHVSQEEVIEATESARAYSAVPIDVPSAATGMSIADSLMEPDTALGKVELRHALRPVLAELPPRERQALVLRFVENRTQSEIAKVLGVSQVHVSRLLAKTLGQLREKLPDVHWDA
ncbi:SigB/SigF/SigG family RNA polymerase sigma factor [Jatrophihabitans telluris]|uniref:SigB/SigF/SigG family RNA polymerase sigma factor n=1 Tax=Jatrophihabitans telluris TaxID=2038343 RepID=A0ABY4R261_9ACTN|nr:SigB/SigF/SigG family RNA polymerase sigma factor [Jatrophihabitans telluris]UQX89815.1 SigB/SigF/SigG family RNA polymerase sigma factor [Jatrophihabitans telluris]